MNDAQFRDIDKKKRKNGNLSVPDLQQDFYNYIFVITFQISFYVIYEYN